LHEPGDAVEEVIDATSVAQLGIPQYNTRDINGKVSIPLDYVCKGKREEENAEQHNGVEGTVGDFCAIDQPDRQPTEK